MAMYKGPKYEYLVYQVTAIDRTDCPTETTLTAFGKNGWKVVTHVITRDGTHVYTLERPFRLGRS